jgi:hypothetical protein
MTRTIASVLRRISHTLDPDAWLDAVIEQRARVRAAADVAQGDAARLAGLTEHVGSIATCIRSGDRDLRNELLDTGAVIAEWLEALA